MNPDNIRRVAEVIRTHPQQFNMDEWEVKGDCGTIMCIGGWCHHLIIQDARAAGVCEDMEHLSREEAADFLGLTPEEGSDLFYPENSQFWNAFCEKYGLPPVCDDEMKSASWDMISERPAKVADWLEAYASGETPPLGRFACHD